MKRVTKADLEEQNARLSSENFALTLPLAYNLDLDSHKVGVVSITDSANGNSHVVLSRVEVFHFLPWRSDGGCVWLREPTGEKSPRRSTFHITAMTQVDFNRFCEEKARVGQYEWREVQALCNRALVEAAREEKEQALREALDTDLRTLRDSGPGPASPLDEEAACFDEPPYL